MISYLIAANCYGFLFYCFYLLLLKGRSSHTWNRAYLLSVALLSLALPLVRISLPHTYTPVMVQQLRAVTLPEISPVAGGAAAAPWYSGWTLLTIAYSLITFICFSRFLYRMAALRRFLGRQQLIQQDGYRLALNTGIGPASYYRTILFPGTDIDPLILEHEKAHIRYCHHYDRLLLQLLQCFFFPVLPLYLVSRELSLVHEFEADAAAGKDQEDYIRVLLSEHLGLPAFALLQPFFRHPLRRRIAMLRKGKRSSPWTKGATLAGSLLLLLTIVYAQSTLALPVQLPVSVIKNLTSQPQEAAPDKATPTPETTAPAASERQPETQPAPVALKTGQGEPQTINRQDIARLPQRTLSLAPADEGRGSRDAQQEKIFTSVEDMPQPPFDVMQYLAEHIRYPQEAKQQNIQGRVVLQFVIAADGSVRHVVLQRDIGGGCGAEAVRVVKDMPRWKPGRQNGEPVQVYYTLPVSFRLEQPAARPVSGS